MSAPQPYKGSEQIQQGEDLVVRTLAPPGVHWFGVFGFSFLGEDGNEQPFALAGGAVTGFAFTVSGPELPPLRFNALPGGVDPNSVTFCAPFESVSGTVEMPLESLTASCWEPGGQPLQTMSLANIGWNIVSDVTIDHPFDFCISDLRPILR